MNSKDKKAKDNKKKERKEKIRASFEKLVKKNGKALKKLSDS